MSKYHKNIKMQLNKALDSKLRIGESKQKIYSNPNKAAGIHSIGTAGAYRSTICVFGDYLKGQGVRDLNDIGEREVKGFLDSRSDLSPWTLAKDLSAINKVLGTEYTGRDMGIPMRNAQDITNNRGYSAYNTSGRERNTDALRFVAATGIRRESIGSITPSQAVFGSNGQVIGFDVVEKGGRERLCVVLEPEREYITQLVQAHLEAPYSPLLSPVDANANPHYFRAEYAQALYNELAEAKSAGVDYYDGMRERFINEANAERAMSRYAHDVYRGYDLSIVAEVSQNLGHNRLDVVLTHYLK